MILIGNKCDQEAPTSVALLDGKQFAEKEGLFFIETSAKDAIMEALTEAISTYARDVVCEHQIECDFPVWCFKAHGMPFHPADSDGTECLWRRSSDLADRRVLRRSF
jgi:hypothetical protein